MKTIIDLIAWAKSQPLYATAALIATITTWPVWIPIAITLVLPAAIIGGVSRFIADLALFLINASLQVIASMQPKKKATLEDHSSPAANPAATKSAQRQDVAVKIAGPFQRDEVHGLLDKLFKERIAFIDGAMGTMIQKYKLSEADFRGSRYLNHGHELKGNNDLLVLTKPDVIAEIHMAYLEGGADIIETNTFNGTWISQSDYLLQADEEVASINKTAAQLAKSCCLKYMAAHPDKGPKFAAGAVGPTNKTLSVSPSVENPAFRGITYDEVVDAYYKQMESLYEGGVDLFLVETIFDTLNAKAAIFALEKFFEAK
jgi:hypothetical protein